MENEVFVSAIVPVYNAEKWLERCVKSIVNQTLNNIEIILIDDGSCDGSGDLCESFATNDTRIRVIHNNNGGPSKARNAGMRVAVGEYIAFVDADDEIKSNMYEMMFKRAHENGDVCDIVMCNICNSNRMEETIINLQLNDVYNTNAEIVEEIIKFFYNGKASGLASPCNKLYRREFLRYYSIEFDEGRIRAEDYFFNFYAFKYANLVRTMAEPYYIYHQDNSNSIMHSYRENQYYEWKRDNKELLEQADYLPLDINYNKFWGSFIYNTYMYILDTVERDLCRTNNIIHILKDDMLYQAICKVGKSLPVWIKIMNLLIKVRFYHVSWLYIMIIYKMKRHINRTKE